MRWLLRYVYFFIVATSLVGCEVVDNAVKGTIGRSLAIDGTFEIQNNLRYTNQPLVTLVFSSDEAKTLSLFSNATCSGPKQTLDFVSSSPWTLETLNGENKISAQFYDEKKSSNCVTKTIIHDDQSPNLPTSLSLGSAPNGLTASPTLTFNTAIDEGLSGVKEYKAQLLLATDDTVIAGLRTATSGMQFSGLSLTSGETYKIEFYVIDNASNSTMTTLSWIASDLSNVTLTGSPSGFSNVTNLNITLGGTSITHYRYKVGASATTVCSVSTGYSATIAVGTPITDDISAVSDGAIRVCAIGYNGVIYQSLSNATVATWTKDTDPPTNEAVSINSGDAYTNVSPASLGLTATDATQVYITNTAGCGSGGTWQTFAASLNWPLTTNTVHNVYAKFRDAALNESTCVTDAITHDNQNPDAVAAVTLGAVPASLSSTPPLSWAAASDNGPALVARYELEVRRASDNAIVSAYAPLASGGALTGLTLVDGLQYYVRARTVDQATNTSVFTQSANWIATQNLVGSPGTELEFAL